MAEQERIAQLEAMCKELHSLLYAAPLDLHPRHEAWYERYDAMEEQYYALFQQKKAAQHIPTQMIDGTTGGDGTV